jgi:hypothetical protein
MMALDITATVSFPPSAPAAPTTAISGNNVLITWVAPSSNGG